MKVGLYLGNFADTAGGALTFQEEVLQSLVENVDACSHSFVLFSPQPPCSVGPFHSNRLRLAPYRRGSIERGINFVSGLFPQFRVASKCPSAFDRAARNEGVRFVWFVSNAFVPVNLPYMCTVWDLQHRLQPWFPEVGSISEWYCREDYYTPMIQRASIILTGTEVGRNEIVHFYRVSPKNVRIVPQPTPRLAIETNHDDGVPILSKYNIPADYLFYPAQFWPHKNHVSLLSAVRLLRDKYGLSMPVVFTGEDKGNKAYVMRRVSELGLSGQVFFLGFVPHQDLIELYRHAFALVFLTLFGPDNLPPLEAFALGCPVIASRVPGAEEQMTDAALLVDPTDCAQIAQKIIELYRTPCQRHALTERGYQRARTWTGREYVQRIFSILDEFELICDTFP